MATTDRSGPDIDEIMAKIREEVSKQRMNNVPGPSLNENASFNPSSGFTFNRAEIFQTLNRAELNSKIGTKVPAMERFSKYYRQLARLIAKVIIYLTQVISTPQRIFNQNILQAIHQMIRYQEHQVDQLEKANAYLKTSLSVQERKLDAFLKEARKRLPGSDPEVFGQEQLHSFVHEKNHFTDSIYLAFEDQFRGTRLDVKQRLKVYLPAIKNISDQLQILDIGCGRGEWLELLKQESIEAHGVDLNQVLVDQCLELGLDVVKSETIEYLKSLSDNSLDGVTGFHFIEHLPYHLLLDLIDEIVRVLRPGGIVIFETPNPQNLLVGACDFYRDPTHQNPIHPDTIAFLSKSRGIVNGKSYFFKRKDGQLQLTEASEHRFDELCNYLEISRDFAFIGYKP